MDDKVLFGSDDGNFYALDAETGTTVWTFETGRQVRTSPLVADGVVYFGADDLFMSAVNIDDGEEVWRNKVEGTMRSSPVIVRGTLFFGTDSGVLYAYDARTGLLNWETTLTSTRHLVRSSPAAIGDTIFVANTRSGPFKSNLFALDRSSGDEVWSYPMEGWANFSGAVGGGAVFISTTEGAGVRDTFRWSNARLYAIEQSSGELRWMLHREDVGAWTTPAVTEDLVLFGWLDGRLEALDIQTGEVEWVFETGDPIFAPPTVADGFVYFGTNDGRVWAVDIVTGQKRWEFQTDVESDYCREDCGGSANAPVISNGVLYIGNNAGFFYALESPSR